MTDEIQKDDEKYGKQSQDEPEANETGSEQLHVICDRKSTYDLKLCLKQYSLFDPHQPLRQVSQDADFQRAISKIPTQLTRPTPPLHPQVTPPPAVLSVCHPSIQLPPAFIQSASGILLGFQWIPTESCNQQNSCKNQSASPLRRAVETYFGLETSQVLMDELPGWELYHDFLLFQSNGFQSPSFLKLLQDLPQDQMGNSSNKPCDFFEIVANQFGVSHVARKGLIDRSDVSRQPKLIPLHGRFRDQGFDVDRAAESFKHTFWTSTKFPTPKGPITYVWAPSETMYSRGNSKEKLRIACLPNVTGQIVVDMCCGIGFFSFGYLLAGAAKVVACEISAWAVEGLRRGAISNGFTYEMVGGDGDSGPRDGRIDSSSAQLLIFHGPNQHGLPIYSRKATHVNLGLLPSSVEFIPQSLEALRPEGGWLHIHGEITAPGGPLARQDAAHAWAQHLAGLVLSLGRRSAQVVNIHWIKSIGPAKEHLVVELQVGSLV